MGMPTWLKGDVVGFSESERGVLGCLPHEVERKHCARVWREARRRGLELTEGDKSLLHVPVPAELETLPSFQNIQLVHLRSCHMGTQESLYATLPPPTSYI